MSDNTSSTVDADDSSQAQSVTPQLADEPVNEKWNPQSSPVDCKQVTVTWQQLSVHVPASEAVQGDTLWSEVDPRNWIQSFRKSQESVS